jgi:hypothetical protein
VSFASLLQSFYIRYIFDNTFTTEMGRTCGAHGEKRGACRALVGKPEERNHLEDPGIDGRIILKWIFERLDGGMDWISLASE